MATSKITRDDIERQLRALQGDVNDEVASKKQTMVAGIAATGVILLILFFLLGKRSGKKKTTIVEIRRV
jgi:hypothetical protein